MLMSDFEIRTAKLMRDILIDPYDEQCMQPNSYELHLDKEIMVHDGKKSKKVSLPYTLKQHEFVLGSTTERITINNRAVGILKGKSTIARHGVQIECAGVVDTGFSGTLTLEIYNHGWTDFELKEGMVIAQILFDRCNTPKRLYNSTDNHYQNQDGVTMPYV